MSEIKGQMLGLVLVLSIFGLVAGVIYSSFQTSANNLSSKIAEENSMITAAKEQKSAVNTLSYFN